jgi:hypothetical protein
LWEEVGKSANELWKNHINTLSIGRHPGYSWSLPQGETDLYSRASNTASSTSKALDLNEKAIHLVVEGNGGSVSGYF